MLPVFRCPPILPDRERKRFLAFARNDDRGKGVLSCRRSPRAGKAAVGGILPPSVGRRCPEGAEDRSAPQGQPSMRRDERGCEIARSPASSSKAEPRDLNVIAAFCIGEETQNFFLLSLSHSLHFTGVQGRFLASLEMTIGGK